MSSRTAVETIQAAADKLESLRTASLMTPDFYEASLHRVVTLHRTLDAQLALLRNVTEVYGEEKTPSGLLQAITGLARAILGESS